MFFEKYSLNQQLTQLLLKKKLWVNLTKDCIEMKQTVNMVFQFLKELWCCVGRRVKQKFCYIKQVDKGRMFQALAFVRVNRGNVGCCTFTQECGGAF